MASFEENNTLTTWKMSWLSLKFVSHVIACRCPLGFWDYCFHYRCPPRSELDGLSNNPHNPPQTWTLLKGPRSHWQISAAKDTKLSWSKHSSRNRCDKYCLTRLLAFTTVQQAGGHGQVAHMAFKEHLSAITKMQKSSFFQLYSLFTCSKPAKVSHFIMAGLSVAAACPFSRTP